MSNANTFEISDRVYYLLIVFLVGLLGFWSFRVFEIWNTANGNVPPHEITVEATGMSYVTPDIATLNLGVHTQAKTSEDAVNQNTQKINDVMKTLTDLGVKKVDTKTINFSLNPHYQYTQEKGSFQDGFDLDQSIEVKVRDFQKIGDIIAKTTSAGANMIGGINFSIENRETAKAEARKQAVENAKIKAQQLSDLAGIKLGNITNFNEYESGGSVPMTLSRGVSSMSAEKVAAPIVEAGQQQIILTVSVTYRTK